MESSQIMRCHKSQQDGFCLGEPPHWWYLGWFMASGSTTFLCCAMLRPISIRWESWRGWDLHTTGGFHWSGSLPQTQPSPSNWTREAGVARKFGSAPARDGWFTWLRLGLTTAMDLFGMGNMVKNLINHGKTEVSQFWGRPIFQGPWDVPTSQPS